MRRSRLEHRFDDAAADVVLVAAPAGFGKTTAVAQWAATLRRPVRWLSIGHDDNDPRTLVTHLAAAVAADERHRPNHEPIGATAEPPTDGHLAFVRALELQAPQTVLVLSRVEVLTSPVALAVLDQLLVDLPTGVQLVLDTRRRPPLSLGRLRAAGRLDEIGPGALRFDVADTVALIERLRAGPVDEAAGRRLVRHTGGWPAVTYLTVQALAARADLPSADAPPHPDVVDFVTTEVLDRYDTDTLDLLAQVAQLDDYDADLAGDITGDPGAQARFEALRRADPIIQPAGTGGRYRVEPTVRAVARTVLERQRPDVVARTRRRAGRVLAERGEAGTALRLAITADDRPLVRDIVRRHWSELPPGSTVISAALRQLGDEAIVSDPEVALVAAWHAGMRCDGHRLDHYLAHCADATDRPASTFRTVASGAALCRAVFGIGGLGEVRDAARYALSLEHDPRWRRLAATCLAWCHVIAGAWGRALHPLSPTGSTVPADGAADEWSALVRALASAVQAIALADVGLIGQATAVADEATAAGTADGGCPSVVAWSLRASGGVLARRGRLTEALPVLEDALRLHRAGPWQRNGWPQAELLLTIIPLRWLEGRRAAATAALAEVHALLGREPDAGALPRRLAAIEQQLSTWAVSGVRLALTDREIEILRHIRSGLTRRQVADELHVSLNTIKSHLRAAYGKLDATSRDDALARGRAVGVL